MDGVHGCTPRSARLGPFPLHARASLRAASARHRRAMRAARLALKLSNLYHHHHMASSLRPLTACARSGSFATEAIGGWSAFSAPRQCRATAAFRLQRRRGFQTKVTLSKFPDFAFTFE